jgi:EmrB/QacA subfamily drug resistance transporter
MGIKNSPVIGSLNSLPRKQVFWTLAGVMLAMFLSSLDQMIVGTAMPRIISDLGGFNQYTWVTTAYIITSAVTVPIVGKLIDMYGRKSFYIAGIAIFITFSLACGLSQTMTQVIFFRGAQGIGAGIMMANAFTVIADMFPPSERGKYQGYLSSLFGVSSVIGPTLGGFLTDKLSWHWVFFVNVPLGILVIIMFILFFPNIRIDNLKHKVDYPGVAALILTVVPALIALSWGGTEYPWGSAEIIGMFLFSAVMLIIFLFIESRAKEPILPLSIFRNRIISVSSVAIFLTAIGMFGGITFVPLFFQGVKGATATQSGNYLIPMTMGIIFGSIMSGQVLSRAGGHYRTQGIVGLVIMIGGMFLLSRITADTTFWTLATFTVITGFGLGITLPLYTIAVQNAAPPNMLGVATASSTFFRSVGGAVGLAILGSVMNNRFASELITRIPPDVKSAVPPDQLAALTNPQALVNPQVQAQLQSTFSQIPQGQTILAQMFVAIKAALASAIAECFLIAMVIIIIALGVTLFLKEIPLRKHHAGAKAEAKPAAGTM